MECLGIKDDHFLALIARKTKANALCHTEITEITERYIYVPIDFMSHRNHRKHGKDSFRIGHDWLYVSQKYNFL